MNCSLLCATMHALCNLLHFTDVKFKTVRLNSFWWWKMKIGKCLKSKFTAHNWGNQTSVHDCHYIGSREWVSRVFFQTQLMFVELISSFEQNAVALMTCHSRKGSGIPRNVTDGSIPFKSINHDSVTACHHDNRQQGLEAEAAEWNSAIIQFIMTHQIFTPCPNTCVMWRHSAPYKSNEKPFYPLALSDICFSFLWYIFNMYILDPGQLNILFWLIQDILI